MATGLRLGRGGQSSAEGGCTQFINHHNVWIGVPSLPGSRRMWPSRRREGPASPYRGTSYRLSDRGAGGLLREKSYVGLDPEDRSCPPPRSTTAALTTSCFDHHLEHLPSYLAGTVNCDVKLETNRGIEHPYSGAVSHDSSGEAPLGLSCAAPPLFAAFRRFRPASKARPCQSKGNYILNSALPRTAFRT